MAIGTRARFFRYEPMTGCCKGIKAMAERENAISLSAATARGRRGEWIMVRGLMHVLMGGAQAVDEGPAFMRLVIAHDASGVGAVWGFVVAMAKLVDYDGKEVVAFGTIV